MRVLGRAAHFISDIGCTVHVANMKYQDKANNVHYAFEKHVSTTCTRHTADSFDKRLLKYYGKDNFGEASNRIGGGENPWRTVGHHQGVRKRRSLRVRP